MKRPKPGGHGYHRTTKNGEFYRLYCKCGWSTTSAMQETCIDQFGSHMAGVGFDHAIERTANAQR